MLDICRHITTKNGISSKFNEEYGETTHIICIIIFVAADAAEYFLQVPVAKRFKAVVCAAGMPMYCECCVFSGKRLRDGPNPRLEESCRKCCATV